MKPVATLLLEAFIVGILLAGLYFVLSKYVKPFCLERGHLLIAQGDKDRKIFFLESGDLKVDTKTPAGLVHLHGPGAAGGPAAR